MVARAASDTSSHSVYKLYFVLEYLAKNIVTNNSESIFEKFTIVYKGNLTFVIYLASSVRVFFLCFET
jgi:hypothetical protein